MCGIFPIRRKRPLYLVNRIAQTNPSENTTGEITVFHICSPDWLPQAVLQPAWYVPESASQKANTKSEVLHLKMLEMFEI